MIDRFIAQLGAFRHEGRGIRDWSVLVSESRRLSLGTKDRHTGGVHAPLSVSEGCGARFLLVWSDGRISRGSLERRELDEEAGQALARAGDVSIEDPDSDQIPGPGEYPDVLLHSDRVAGLASGDLAVLAGRLEAVRKMVERQNIPTWSGSMSASEATSRLKTSRGLDLESRRTSFGWSTTLGGEIGDGWYACGLDDEEEWNGRLNRLAGLFHRLSMPCEPPPGGAMPVLMHPNVVERFVLGTIFSNLDGATVVNGESYFRKEQFGAAGPVLRPDLTLRLDPLEPLKSGSYRFTLEGVPASRCSFVENGRLVRPVLDLKYARRFGAPATPVPAGPDTLHLEGPPELAETSGYEAAEGGVLVLSVLGIHTQDPASGDFSLSAPQALAIRNGRAEGRLRGTLSGNLFDLLRSDGLLRVRFPGEHTPGLLVRCRFDPK